MRSISPSSRCRNTSTEPIGERLASTTEDQAFGAVQPARRLVLPGLADVRDKPSIAVLFERVGIMRLLSR